MPGMALSTLAVLNPQRTLAVRLGILSATSARFSFPIIREGKRFFPIRETVFEDNFPEETPMGELKGAKWGAKKKKRGTILTSEIFI